MHRPLIAVMRGGYSGESVISHGSAQRMMAAIDDERYDALHITVTRQGWTCEGRDERPLEFDRGRFMVGSGDSARRVDAVLMAIHGSPGEDGLLQGQLELLGIPCQTGDVLNMAITFSKYTTTALLRQMGFSVASSVRLHRGMTDLLDRAGSLGFPCFVKPDQAGSSLGISKVKHPNDLLQALDMAFAECPLVMVEAAVIGRELTCGVVESPDGPVALPVCEIRTPHEFFDFDAKYHATDTEELVPAPIPDKIAELVQERSVAIYRSLGCRGIVRVDHFWIEDQQGEQALVTIEVNTVPGFTKASILPRMLAAAGLDADRLINGMIERMLA